MYRFATHTQRCKHAHVFICMNKYHMTVLHKIILFYDGLYIFSDGTHARKAMNML